MRIFIEYMVGAAGQVSHSGVARGPVLMWVSTDRSSWRFSYCGDLSTTGRPNLAVVHLPRGNRDVDYRTHTAYRMAPRPRRIPRPGPGGRAVTER